MKKYLLAIFILAIVAAPGDSFAENSANSAEDTKSNQETNPPASYQDENISISFIRAYRIYDGSDYFLELEVKVLSDHKIINPKNVDGYQDSQSVNVELADNFGNSLGFDRWRRDSISPRYRGTADEKGLRRGQNITFTIKFTDLPLESTKYLILKIPKKTFGNTEAFELKIKDFKPIIIKTAKQLEKERRLQTEQLKKERQISKTLWQPDIETATRSVAKTSRFSITEDEPIAKDRFGHLGVQEEPAATTSKFALLPILISIICAVLGVTVVVFVGVLFYRRILPKIICWLLKSFKYIFLSLRHILWSGIILFVAWCLIAAISDLYIRTFLPIALAIISLTAGGMYTLHKKSDEL